MGLLAILARMDSAAALFTVARGVGETEQALLDQLDQWAQQGHVLPVAVVAGLRRMAYNCDSARPGQGLAQATDRYLTQLRDWQPSGQVSDDRWQQVLDRASSTQV